MPKANLPFGKIVATPTSTGWSQSYSAGSIYLTISLTATQEVSDQSLQNIGKKVINDFEAEFFTLEEKSLATIKKALNSALSPIPDTLLVSIAAAVVKDSILYVFLIGAGAVLLKRKGEIAVILEETDANDRSLKSSSGFLIDGDIVVLTTNAFRMLIPPEKLQEALETNSVDDIAEILSPLVHDKEEGGAASVFFSFHTLQKDEDVEEEIPILEEPAEKLDLPSPEENRVSATEPKQLIPKLSNIRRRLRLPEFKLSHKRKVLLSVTFVLIAILMVSIFFSLQSRSNAKNRQVFLRYYQPAKKAFEEGEGLIELNSVLARDNLSQAKKLLENGKNQLPAGSKEAKEIALLLEKVESSLARVSDSKQIDASEIEDEQSPLLAAYKTSKNIKAVTQDQNSVFFLTKSEIGRIEKQSGDRKSLIQNDNDWLNAVGLGTFYGNLYVLDTQKGIIKFTQGEEGYGKSAYLKEDIDLTKAISLAIDSSIYVLFNNGKILKFTRGTPDVFVIKGLIKSLSKPIRIYTYEEAKSVYVLDPASSRIVQFAKDGSFEQEYISKVLQKAVDFEVKEQEKKIFVLAGGKIYKLSLD
jgi:DNA-dependent RNA polymerase auxiliary subunit epsilon